MYDFDTVIDRRGTGTCKWEQAPKPVVDAGVTPLSIADMEFKMPPQVQRALHEAVEHGVCGYTLPDEAYFAAVSGWQQRRHGWKVQKEWLRCTPGVVTALGVAVRALTGRGDAVIIQPPVYMPFWSAVRGNGRTLLENRLLYKNGHYEMDFEDLERLCARPEAKLLILCSPHNPVGRVWTEEELLRLGNICKKHSVTVLADEIHQDIVFPGYKHTSFAALPGMQDNCVVCTAVSKTFNLAGLFCSNIFIPNPDLRDKFAAVQITESPTGVPFYGRAASIAAFTECDDWVDEMVAYVEGNFEFIYDYLAKKLPEIKCIRAEGTYLAWFDMSALGMDDKALEELVVNKGHLALDEGYIFGTGGSGFERWNIALPRAELEKALERLRYAIRG